jgi:hypothetical protein
LTVAELLSRISSRELSEWQAYYAMEPFGGERDDLQAGLVASTIANVNRDPKKRKQAYTPQDFLPKFGGGGGGDKPGWKTMLERVKMLNAAFGGTEGPGAGKSE